MKACHAIFVLLALFFLCERNKTAAEETQRYKVGIIVPLSGSLAPMGEAFRRGVELSQRDGLASHVEFIFEDHKYDGRMAVTALHKLRGTDDIDLAIVWGNTPSSSCAPVAEQQKIPMIAESMNPDAKGRQYVVTLGSPIEQLVDRIFEQFDEWKLVNPAAVSVDLGNALQGVELLNKKLNGKLHVKTVASDESDFKTILAGLKSRAVDGLLLFALPDQALMFLRQANQLQYFPKIVGGDVFADRSFQEEVAKLTPNLKLAYGAVDPKFIRRLMDLPESASYFFETASGYALASLAESIAIKAKSAPADANPLSLLGSIDVSGLPLGNMRFVENEEYGRHFEVDGAIYSVPLQLD